VLYATTYDGADPVRVSLPEVNLPFDLHSQSFFMTPDYDVLYVDDNRQTLYRAQCERSD
jgi:hypothetical protein